MQAYIVMKRKGHVCRVVKPQPVAANEVLDLAQARQKTDVKGDMKEPATAAHTSSYVAR